MRNSTKNYVQIYQPTFKNRTLKLCLWIWIFVATASFALVSVLKNIPFTGTSPMYSNAQLRSTSKSVPHKITPFTEVSKQFFFNVLSLDGILSHEKYWLRPSLFTQWKDGQTALVIVFLFLFFLIPSTLTLSELQQTKIPTSDVQWRGWGKGRSAFSCFP